MFSNQSIYSPSAECRVHFSKHFFEAFFGTFFVLLAAVGSTKQVPTVKTEAAELVITRSITLQGWNQHSHKAQGKHNENNTLEW